MDLDFQNVEVNSTPMNGGLVFDYVPVEMGATSPDSRTTILWPNNTRSFVNQSNEWTAANNYQLHFNIGTINVSQQWNTTYRLRANQTGLINLFNCTVAASSLSFNNGIENMCLPDLFITVNPNSTPLGLQNGSLLVTDLIPESGDYNVSVPLNWNLYYSGVDTGIETYYYCFKTPSNPCCDECDSQFLQFGTGHPFTETGGGNIPRNTTLDVTNFPAGEYRIKVTARVPGIPSGWDTGGFNKSFNNAPVSIILR
jgi:hypothetical protein